MPDLTLCIIQKTGRTLYFPPHSFSNKKWNWTFMQWRLLWWAWFWDKWN